ncbi:hypothetical protein BH10CYA1_BH10CYA1_23860 [soil metagenome]
MSRIFVLILGALVGYVAYNLGSRLRSSRELSADTNGGDSHDESWMPITVAESIRRAVAEKQARGGSAERKDD